MRAQLRGSACQAPNIISPWTKLSRKFTLKGYWPMQLIAELECNIAYIHIRIDIVYTPPEGQGAYLTCQVLSVLELYAVPALVYLPVGHSGSHLHSSPRLHLLPLDCWLD